MGNLEYCNMTKATAREKFKQITGKTPTKEDIENMDTMREDLVEYFKSALEICTPRKYAEVFPWRKREYYEAMKEIERAGFYEDESYVSQSTYLRNGSVIISARKKDLENDTLDDEGSLYISLNAKKILKKALDLEFGNV